MTTTQPVPDRVHFVGSIGLDTVQEVFRAVGPKFGARLRRIPDGEPGGRRGWIQWQYSVLFNNPFLARRPGYAADSARRTARRPCGRREGARRSFRRTELRPGGTRVLSRFLRRAQRGCDRAGRAASGVPADANGGRLCILLGEGSRRDRAGLRSGDAPGGRGRSAMRFRTRIFASSGTFAPK